MNKIFKLLLILFMLAGAIISPLCIADAAKWNRGLILIYLPQDNPYDAMFKKAVAEWQSKTKKMTLYVSQVPKDIAISEVDVTINKVSGEEVKNSESVNMTASTVLFKHAKVTVDVNVTPEILNDPEKNLENNDEIYALMLRTVGKILGVPESQDPNSVMYREYVKGQTILMSDVENLYNLYHWVLPPSMKK